ncbi:ABC transporter-like protein [Pholiota conissans]|uniref:ABC transporter-like protein n=1 Tax=Pholiota conissans TaxID=109636 RepID=A0A9P5ZD80_9AGAR|nr:ABC transporter-like protein [Pholiota conissans]
MSDVGISVPGSNSTQPELTWLNVAIGLAFIVVDIGISTVFRLGLGVSLAIAALRCTGQLALVATILHQVFENKNPWTVALISFVLNFLGTFETVVNKSPRRFQHMFPVVLIGMLGSTIPISILGSRFAMGIKPFWTPMQYIPIVGMLCGATISAIVVAVSYILKELQENKDKVEIYLAFGATRTEACRPIMMQALKLALTPLINSMSVIGIIAIPGMMTGALLGGASVQQAAKLQTIIMFMITASATLASVFITLAVVVIVVDEQHRVRSERISGKGGSWLNIKQLNTKKMVEWTKEKLRPRPKPPVKEEESEELLLNTLS